jgi:hypothetical protein
MSLFNAPDLRAKAQIELARAKQRTFSSRTLSYDDLILEHQNILSKGEKTFDIFLSHSFKDAELVIGLKKELQEMGYSVYIDWIEDTQLDRSKVDKKTAATLRERMDNCRSLFYASTDNATQSVWMPWELGYMDGKKQTAAILPITQVKNSTDEYLGQEYLGMYPYVTKQQSIYSHGKLMICNNSRDCTPFEHWVAKNQIPSNQLFNPSHRHFVIG